jgi:peptidoglycan/xylan/chitin deacetylase (PgdA/CDA1 family)
MRDPYTNPASKAMISLTFDDALDVHLDTAMPILERAGLRGTFYVHVGSEGFLKRYRDWANAAARGHELGNHTVFHPGVSTKSWVSEGISLESYTLDRMRRELVLANQVLTMVDGRCERSFAFPCSNPWLGRAGWPRCLLTQLQLDRTRLMGFVDTHGLDFGSKLTNYTPLVRELFPAARCGGIDIQDLPVVPPDRHQVHGVAGDGLSLTALLEAVDKAAARGAWLVLVFHGVDGGHQMSIAKDVFSSLCDQLYADDRVEVLPFLEAAKQLWPRVGNVA